MTTVTRYLIVAVKNDLSWRTSSNLEYASKLETVLATANLPNIQAVIAHSLEYFGEELPVMVFGSSCRFEANIMEDLAFIVDKRLARWSPRIRFFLSSLATTKPSSPYRATLHPPLHIRPIHHCQLSLGNICQETVEKHVPSAINVVMGMIAAAQELGDPTAQVNPDDLPNHLTFDQTATLDDYQLDERYHPPSLTICGVTLAKALVCIEAVCAA
jgi:hypothetical protein